MRFCGNQVGRNGSIFCAFGIQRICYLVVNIKILTSTSCGERVLVSKSNPSKWPKSPCEDELESQVAMNEKVKTEPVVARAMLMWEYKTLLCVENIVELQRFSNKDKLLRCIGWVLRFISNLKSTIKESAFNFNPTLSVFEVNKSKCMLVISIQKESFAKQIHYLSLKYSEKGEQTPPFTLTS